VGPKMMGHRIYFNFPLLSYRYVFKGNKVHLHPYQAVADWLQLSVCHGQVGIGDFYVRPYKKAPLSLIFDREKDPSNLDVRPQLRPRLKFAFITFYNLHLGCKFLVRA
jgi:hypothetical protein